MKYFEINDPCFSIIGAEDEEKCMKLYEDVVCDIEDKEEFRSELKELEITTAIDKVAKTISEETKLPVGINEASDQVQRCIDENISCLLAVDGGLV